MAWLNLSTFPTFAKVKSRFTRAGVAIDDFLFSRFSLGIKPKNSNHESWRNQSFFNYQRKRKEQEARRPPKFPMKFEDFLRRVIGGRSYGYRLPIFKRYKRHAIRYSADRNFGFPKNITDGEIESAVVGMVVKFKRDGVDRQTYNVDSFEIWRWRADLLQSQRTEAAKKRWKKNSNRPIDTKIKLKSDTSHISFL